jgi:diguanylate cyclase (GGDEF)-like protein
VYVADPIAVLGAMAKQATAARTAVALWLDKNERLSIQSVVSDTSAVQSGETVPMTGPLRAVIREARPIYLREARAEQMPYYVSPVGDAAFAAVPICDGEIVRGVLCADSETELGEPQIGLLLQFAKQIEARLHSERAFLDIERARYEHAQFYEASAMLCHALTLEQVMETAFDAARLIVDYDLAALTLYDSMRRSHRVAAVRINPKSPPLCSQAALLGLEFRENSGLASAVVKNRHPLPASGEVQGQLGVVFTETLPLRGVVGLTVLPLLCGEEAIGTLTLASRHPGRFQKDVREMLGVIASQVAISIQNALMYRQMETMATTDGLTGLTNHRTFQERLTQIMERASRHNQKVALLLCDVDHFKQVNDTYGHPVGDQVLRKVAQVLNRAVRRIDLTARYGGEEFAVLLEATDEAGALHLAERIRQDVEALRLESDVGRFSVTTSIGVACYPDDATEQAELIEHADQALYAAKEGGRNRVVAYRESVAELRRRAV